MELKIGEKIESICGRVIKCNSEVFARGDLLLNPAKEIIQNNVLDTAFNEQNLLRLAALGDDVCLYGAAYYALLNHIQ